MAIHRTAQEMTGSHIGIYVSMGRNFPQGDTQKSVWDEIPWARTHRDMVAYKGNHIGLYRMKFRMKVTRETMWDEVS